MISFTQNLISVDKNQANICWIVENHTGNIISDATAFSDIFSHSFGSIGAESIKTVTFNVPLSKTAMIGSAVMNYQSGSESHILESNVLENI